MVRLKKQLRASAAAIAITAGILTPTTALTQNVTLNSTDGTISFTGELMNFEEDTYVLRTALGDLRIAASSVICEGEACPTFDDVTADVIIAGSNLIGVGMMPLMLSGYAGAQDADAEISNLSDTETLATLISDGGFGDEIGSYLVTATSDADAFQSLLEGTADIGMASRRITIEEARALRDAGAGSMISPNQERIIAVDSMVVVAHANNPVSDLTEDELSGIFSGEITNWSEVGGEDRPITVISQEPGSAGYEYFMSFLFEDERPDFLPQGIAQDDQDISNVMFHDQNAISYLGFAFQRGAKPLNLVKECGIVTETDAFSAKTEEYILSRRMYLYNRGDTLNDATQDFLNYASSDASDSVIGKSGFIDLGIARRDQGANDPRRALLQAEVSRFDIGAEGEVFQEMLDAMDSYDRLSTTFRFRTGSSSLDERGRLDMERLIEYLQGVPAGTEVVLVGFTDDVGPFEANRLLAIERAQAVADQLTETAAGRLDNINVLTNGFGEAAPSACNDTDRGRSINRRVEVWISNSVEG